VKELFKPRGCTLIGMVHLGPILRPDSVIDLVEQTAIADALTLAEAGFDAVLIENFSDRPFYPDQVPPHCVAGMTRIAHSVRLALNEKVEKEIFMGINVLRNDAAAALGVAAAVGADFIRVNVHVGAMLTDQGIIQGKAHETVRYRETIHPGCRILADVRVKHAVPLAGRPALDEASDLVERGCADGVILTGDRTGTTTETQLLRAMHERLEGCPIIAGSGVTPDTIPHLAPYIHGVIVGTWIKKNGLVDNPVDLTRAKELVRNVQAYTRS